MPQPFTRNFLLVTAGATLLLAPSQFAQTPSSGTGIPDGGTREVLVSIFIPSLPDAPFTATVNTEWVRPLGDGSRITLKNHRLIARDKSGRIFQERRLLVTDSGKQESAVTQTEITDPIAHAKYICKPQQRVCQLEEFQPLQPLARASPTAAAAAQGKPGPHPEESLGTQWMAGVETSGTRETEVIPAGAIGNDSPLLLKREYWYSKQLGLNILSLREDPRFGSQKFELSDIVAGEPDAKLFAPPEGSKILDLRAPPVVEAPVTPPSQ